MATEQQLALVDALERHKLLVCVGPLVPMAAGLPGLRDLIERCRLRLVELGHHEPDLSGSFADALEHAERLIGSAPFTSLVRAAWEPVVPVPVPASAQALVGLSTGLNALVTTNLDRLLERAFEGRWHTIEEFTPDLAKRTRVIFKVRGTVGQSTTWRLTARQQANDHLADAPRRHALAALLRNHVVLFVGFAPDDEALSELLDVRGHPVADERRRATETSHPDVALVPAATLRERAALGARGVEVVPLAGEYDAAAAAYLQTLADELGRRTHRPVPTVAAEVDAAEPDEENPYPGLQPFTARNRRYFFGREEDLSRVVAQLGQTGRTSHSWLLVDGPSGVGKSSLLQAGLLPALEQGELQILAVPRAWRTVTLRPGPAPVVELANQFHRALIGDGLCDLTASALGAAVQHRAAALVEFVAACLPASDGLVLLVDQLEEALLVPDAGAREGFAAALAELLMRSPRPLLLITALRSDFLGDLPRLPALYERITSTSPPARYTLATLRSAQLAAAIEHPARKARAELEPGLAARVLADAGNIERGGGEDATPETALPLVAAVMTSLYDQRAGRHLTHAQYEALGGVAGALTGRADEALVPLRSRVAEAELWTFFRQFVAADSQGRMTRRSVPRTDALTPLGGGLAAENLLAHLTGSARSMRLIIVRAEGDGRRVDLAHDALLRNWKWLRDHIDRDRVEVLRESELAQAAARWDRLGRPRDGLPSGAEAKYFLRASTVAGSLPRAYQDALRAHMRRRRRAGLAVIAVLASGVLTLAGVSVYAWKQRGETLAKTQLAEEWLDAANSISLEERGSMEESAGNLAAARGHFERSVKARELLAAADPTGAQAQRALSIALERLGNLEVQAGNLVAARGYFERSVKAREVLATTDPTSNRVQSDLSESLERLGDVEVQAGNLIAARGLFERSVKAREMQAADLTGIQDQFEFQWALGGLSISLLKLGEVEVQAGNLVAARGHFDRSLKIAEAVAAADPILGQSAAQRDLSVALERLGNLEVQVETWPPLAVTSTAPSRSAMRWPPPTRPAPRRSATSSSLWISSGTWKCRRATSLPPVATSTVSSRSPKRWLPPTRPAPSPNATSPLPWRGLGTWRYRRATSPPLAATSTALSRSAKRWPSPTRPAPRPSATSPSL
ncbi:SIR2 family protein [Nannocystis pusilla]|uniref:SIR2 family protein n=1 Tax=Nannocystis pusilla TaxID=889268 RepID=A0A9X3EPW8_9BACT|nr:SIR2 family protein [Nannocystis pusilla]MCY1007065.1 SIR2 family protein [Nannocystis pusilla]